MSFFDSLSQGWNDLKSKVTEAVQPSIDTAVQQTGTAPLATTPGAQQTLGTAPEAPGTTMAGGRRKKHRTRRGGRKHKKTSKRRHH